MTVIDVQSVVYIYEGEETALENIPPEAHYACHKMDGAGETAYIELRTEGFTQRIMCYARDEHVQPLAEAVLSHALETGAAYHEAEPELELGVILPRGQFELDVPVNETDMWEATAFFSARLSEDGNSLELGELAGYIVEVLSTEPLTVPSKNIIYNNKKELQTIEYLLLSVDEDQHIISRLSFFESTDPALVDPDEDDDAISDTRPFPVIDQAQLDEDARYVSADYVGYLDFEDRPIQLDDLVKHDNFRRQWANADQRLIMHEIFLRKGIAQTEVLDVPQPMHRRALHAYLRKLHANKELISLDPEAASHYVIMHEPVSHESTEAVPLESGQFKRHASIYTLRGVLVVCQCLVFAEDMRPIKKLDFGRPNEQGLMSEEIFNFDEAGNALESTYVRH